MVFSEHDPQELRTGFNTDGYVYLPGFLGSDGAEEVLTHLDRYVRDVVPDMPKTEVYYESIEDTGTLKQLQRMHLYDSYFESLFTTGPIRSLAQTLLNDEVVPVNMQYFNKPPRIGKPTPPHQDGYYFMLDPCEALTMWLALDHVDTENGCVRYIPGSHRTGVREHGRTNTLGFSQGIVDYGTDDDNENEQAFPAHPGDLLAHHALTVHRADGNTSELRNRRALGFVYFAERAKEDSVAKAAYQERLDEDLLRQGKV